MNTPRLSLLGYAILVALVTSCSARQSPKLNCPLGSNDPRCLLEYPEDPEDPTPTNLSCTASPSMSSVGDGESFSLNISAMGGTAPYSVPSFISSLASVTAFSWRFPNTGSTERQVSDVVRIVDRSGTSVECAFSVTVRPRQIATAPQCSIATNKEQISVGETIHFVLTATGATEATFGRLELQTGWAVDTTRSSPTEARASIVFSRAGTRTVLARVSAAGRESTCTKTILVQAPQIQVVLNPASPTILINQPLLVRVESSGFDPNAPINYAFETSEPGLSIHPNGNSAEIRAADGRYHRFDLTVRASSTSGAVAQPVVISNIVFTSDPVLTCRIEPGPMLSDGSIPFRVVAISPLNVVDELMITEFNAGPGAILTSPIVTNPVSFRFSGTGMQLVHARARSIATNTPCFNGAPFSALVRLRAPLNRCDIVMSANPSFVMAPVTARVAIPENVGSGNYRVDLIAPSATLRAGSSFNEFIVTHPVSGSYSVSGRVTDLADGRVVSCDTIQTVRPTPGAWYP